MIPVLNRLKLNGSVLEFGITPESIIILDNFYNLYEINRSTFQFQKSVQITKTHEVHHKFSKSLAASKGGYTVFALNKSTKGIVLKVEHNLEKITSLAWHKADISNSIFSKDGKYLATGGEDGRTLIYQIPSFNLLATLLPRPDYICGIAFSPESSLLAVSCFDRSTLLFSLERNLEIATFETAEVVEDIGFFNQNKNLLFVCKDGTTGIFDVAKKEIISEEKRFSQWLTRLCTTEDGNYAYIGTRENLLHLIRTKDNQPIASVQTEHIGIASLHLEGNRLFIGYVDGYMEILELDRGIEEFETHLKINDLMKAKMLAEEKNIFLKTSPLYLQKLDEKWKEVLKEAIDLLAKDKFQEALALVAPFMEDPSKKEEFSEYTAQKEFVSKFLDAFEKNDIAEAYRIAEAHPDIRKLSAFEKLEEYWRKIFEACKKLLAAHAATNLPRAQELLKPFASIKEKKESVYTLLHNSDKYVAADNAIKERNYADYFRLAEKFPFLKETETYKKTYLLGQQLVDRIALLENAKDFDKAIEISKFLGGLFPFKNLASERIKLIEKKRAFLEAHSAKDLKKAYTLIEQEENLKALPEYIQLMEQFSMLNERAYSLASKGLSADTLLVLEDYLEIPYWQDKIASTMKIAYLYEIKGVAAKSSSEEIDWKKSIEIYVERFSKDDELMKICEGSGLKKSLDEVTQKGDPQGYKNSPYLSSVIVRFEGD